MDYYKDYLDRLIIEENIIGNKESAIRGFLYAVLTNKTKAKGIKKVVLDIYKKAKKSTKSNKDDSEESYEYANAASVVSEGITNEIVILKMIDNIMNFIYNDVGCVGLIYECICAEHFNAGECKAALLNTTIIGNDSISDIYLTGPTLNVALQCKYGKNGIPNELFGSAIKKLKQWSSLNNKKYCVAGGTYDVNYFLPCSEDGLKAIKAVLDSTKQNIDNGRTGNIKVSNWGNNFNGYNDTEKNKENAIVPGLSVDIGYNSGKKHKTINNGKLYIAPEFWTSKTLDNKTDYVNGLGLPANSLTKGTDGKYTFIINKDLERFRKMWNEVAPDLNSIKFKEYNSKFKEHISHFNKKQKDIGANDNLRKSNVYIKTLELLKKFVLNEPENIKDKELLNYIKKINFKKTLDKPLLHIDTTMTSVNQLGTQLSSLGQLSNESELKNKLFNDVLELFKNFYDIESVGKKSVITEMSYFNY